MIGSAHTFDGFGDRSIGHAVTLRAKAMHRVVRAWTHVTAVIAMKRPHSRRFGDHAVVYKTESTGMFNLGPTYRPFSRSVRGQKVFWKPVSCSCYVLCSIQKLKQTTTRDA